MEFQVESKKEEEAIDITARVEEAAKNKKGKACLIFCPHTTSGLLVNEGYDKDVIDDIILALDKIIPRLDYKHKEGNSLAHIKSSLVDNSLLIPIEKNKLNLGRWQRIFFLEFDGPKERKVYVDVL